MKHFHHLVDVVEEIGALAASHDIREECQTENCNREPYYEPNVDICGWYFRSCHRGADRSCVGSD